MPLRDRRPTLVELEAFRATMAEGTTAAAGRRLGRSQSAISRALIELERRQGQALFERRGRLIVPTAEALALNRRLDPVFAALDALRSPTPRENEPSRLSIAAPPAFAASLIPRAFAAFRRDHPACQLQLEVVATADAVRLVAEGGAEMGLTDSAVSSDAVRVEPFRESRIHCLLPIGHRLSGQDSIAVADLQGERFVALARRHSMRAQIESMLAAARVDHRIAAETSTSLAALGLIKAGIGVGLLNPFPLLEPERMTGLVARPLDVALSYRSAVIVARHTPLSPIAKRFQRFLARFVAADPWSTAIKAP